MVLCPNCKQDIDNIIEGSLAWEHQKVSLYDDKKELHYEYEDTIYVDKGELNTPSWKCFCPECDFEFTEINPDFDIQTFLEDDKLKSIIKEKVDKINKEKKK